MQKPSMPEGLRIIKAGLDDAALLGRIHSQAWQEAYKGIVPDDYLAGFTPEKRAAFFQRILPTTANENYLLYLHDMPIGMLAIGPVHEKDAATEGCGEVHALYLLQDAWGQGVGLAAMDFAIPRLLALGFDAIVLTVLSDNLRARRFYERYGFVPDSEEEPIMLGIPLPELRYRLRR